MEYIEKRIIELIETKCNKIGENLYLLKKENTDISLVLFIRNNVDYKSVDSETDHIFYIEDGVILSAVRINFNRKRFNIFDYYEKYDIDLSQCAEISGFFIIEKSPKKIVFIIKAIIDGLKNYLKEKETKNALIRVGFYGGTQTNIKPNSNKLIPKREELFFGKSIIPFLKEKKPEIFPGFQENFTYILINLP